MSGLMIRSPGRIYLLVDVSSDTGWYYCNLKDLAIEGFIDPLREFGWVGIDSEDRFTIERGRPLFREELMRWDW